MIEHSNSDASDIPTLSTSLLKRIQGMDSVGWSRLVMVFGPLVYRWCRRSGIKEQDAPDVVQEVFATVARSVVGFERRLEQGSFRAWLATITRSRVQDFLRKSKRHPAVEGGTDALNQLHHIADDLDSTMDTNEMESPLARRVLDLVRIEFEETTWQAFWMTTIECLSPSVVAEQLNLSRASVYQARSRVLRKLRQQLNELPE